MTVAALPPGVARASWVGGTGRPEAGRVEPEHDQDKRTASENARPGRTSTDDAPSGARRNAYSGSGKGAR